MMVEELWCNDVGMTEPMIETCGFVDPLEPVISTTVNLGDLKQDY